MNRASAAQLQSALGISLEQAQEIVRYREAHGLFRSWEALAKVPGIDAQKVNASKDRLSLAER